MLTLLAIAAAILLLLAVAVILYRVYRARREAASVQQRLEEWCG